MKKMISLLVVALMATTAFAQSATELAKQQREVNELHRKILNGKITKDAKKQAKEYKKDGWTVPVGELSLERQINKSMLYAEELMTNEEGGITQRFMQHTGRQTAGSYNTAYAAARSAAMTELASLMETKLASAWKNLMDNAEKSAISATTNDRFNQRSMAIIQQSITNAIPTVVCYRVLPNNNYQVMVRLAFDKQEISARLKRNLQKELEMEGDQLEGMVNDMICNEM